MSIGPGTRFGPYQVTSLLGAGGMGEVYRATDTKLGRDVALKVLPEAFAGDPERLIRFQREAQVLAALNHPNVAQIYALEALDLPEEAGPRRMALVMELVEGPTLADLLEQGPLPLDEAFSVARQMAEALEAAHERGIVHRDLKPANVKLTPEGTVKVLDFGLARAILPEPGTESITTNAASSPTLASSPMTAMGVILGTAAYMAPEQAKGKAVDRRADIWAFGCVLAEMLQGKPLYTGETVSEVLAAVIVKEPDLSGLPGGVPSPVKRLLARCLDKDPKRRLRDIGEARLLLERPFEQEPAAAKPARPARPRPRFAAVLTGAGAAIVVAALAFAAGWYAGLPEEPRLSKSLVAVQVDGGDLATPVLSPDGRRIVFESQGRLWFQPLDEWNARELPGTEEGRAPFWSPGSDWVGFFRDDYVLKIPVQGGSSVTLCALPVPQSPGLAGTWTEDGSIFFSLGGGPVYEVSALGGEAREAFPATDEYLDYHDIHALTGRSGLLAVGHRRPGIDTLGILAADGLTVVLQTPGAHFARPVYSPTGHLVYVRLGQNEGVWALPFSLAERKATGDPFVIAAGRWPSVSADGTLAYVSAPATVRRQLAWFTREGTVAGVVAPPRQWREGLSVSRDGRSVAAADADGIWVYDVATGSRSRLTDGDQDFSAVWIGAGERLAFVRMVDRETTLMIKSADAAGEERAVARGARYPSASADGRYLVFNLRRPPPPPGSDPSRRGRAWEPGWVDLQEPDEVHRLGDAHVGGRFPEISPDGRFVLYVSNETGRDEIFLTRFPGGQGKWQVSTDGGGWATWSPGGDEIIYRTRRGEVMAVPVTLGEGVSIGAPKVLFQWDPTWTPFYTFAPDGRGLTAVPVERVRVVPSVRLVRNWLAEFSSPRR